MSPKSHRFFALFFLNFFANEAFAVTLTSGQTDYTTTGNITISGVGISSSLSGSSSSLNKITNTFAITTSGSSAYGIRSTGSYNQITNNSGATILTTGSSGRGISVAGNSIVYNIGSITTQGTTSYGIYAGSGNDTINNSGSITTSNTTSYGIYLASDNNSAINAGTINTQVYGIYSDGNANQISNSGTITTTVGSSAHGIFVSAGSASTASSSSHAIISNSGTINSNANGIYNKDNYSEITNSGSLTTASGSSIYGIRNEGDDVTITNSGTISATNYAIYNSGADTIINNSGTLNGGIQIGYGTLNILGGTISGVVDGSSNSGSVNVGLGITFNQSANFSALNNLTILANGTLNSAAGISANNIFLGDNSNLNLNEGSSLTGSIQGSSASQGIVNISATALSIAGQIGSSTNSLANLNVNSGSALTASSDIYADEIFLEGALNFNGANNLKITGNLAGSGLGTLNIGSQSQTIDGDLSLNSGDKLAVTLKNQGVGNLTVTGAVNIDQNAKIEITTSADQGYIANGTKYQIINSASSGASAADLTTISNSNISVNGNNSNINGLLEFSVQSASDGWNLAINHLAAAQVTSNKNAQNIYQNLVNIGSSSSGKLLEFQEYLDNSGLTGSEIAKTINQLAPQSSKAAIATTNNVVSNSLGISENHLAKKRHKNSEDNLKDGGWGQVFGGSILQKAVQSDDGYKANSAGIAFGTDREISDDTLIGAAFSVAKSSTKTQDSSKQNLIDTYQINFYGSKNFDKYFVDLVSGIALNHFDSSRAITAANADANSGYFGQTYALKVKTGFVKNLHNGFSVTPEASLNFMRNNIGAYNEKGADELNLRVSSVAANFLEVRSGVNFGFSSKITELPEFRKIAALLKISYGYSVINDAPTTSASFQGQSSSFNSQITNVDRGSLKLGTEIAAYHKDDSTFILDYNYERKTTYSSHFAIFKVRQEF